MKGFQRIQRKEKRSLPRHCIGIEDTFNVMVLNRKPGIFLPLASLRTVWAAILISRGPSGSSGCSSLVLSILSLMRNTCSSNALALIYWWSLSLYTRVFVNPGATDFILHICFCSWTSPSAHIIWLAIGFVQNSDTNDLLSPISRKIDVTHEIVWVAELLSSLSWAALDTVHTRYCLTAVQSPELWARLDPNMMSFQEWRSGKRAEGLPGRFDSVSHMDHLLILVLQVMGWLTSCLSHVPHVWSSSGCSPPDSLRRYPHRVLRCRIAVDTDHVIVEFSGWKKDSIGQILSRFDVCGKQTSLIAKWPCPTTNASVR